MSRATKKRVPCRQGVLNNIDLEDIVADRFKKQLRRSDSDDQTLPVYIRNRKQMYAEIQQLRQKLQMQKVEDSTRIHIGFLHASPLVYKTGNEKN